MSISAPILGIDLGTTNSVAAILESGEPRVIPNGEGANKTPSIVAFLEDGKVLVGDAARRQMAANPDRTVFAVKRLMGRFLSDVVESGDDRMFRLQSDEADRVYIDVDGPKYTPQQVSALILRSLKDAAEEHLGQEITRAILTVPAYFDDLQRTATLEAGEMAGLQVLRLINEPTAAAMAYGLGREREELVAIYDFGGGTFDISILEIDNKTFEVVNCSGDTRLGGNDLDILLVGELSRRFEREHGFALDSDSMTLRRLSEAAEKAKCELSTLKRTHVSLPFIGQRGAQPVHLETTIERTEFEDLIREKVRQTIDICADALDEAKIDVKDIGKVILVGGTTRIPLVQSMIEDFFGIQPYKGVNPDEIVALGAAVQAGVLQGDLQEVVLMDVTPHTLGVEVKNGRMSRVVDKNATIPIKMAKMFTTTEDNQPHVNIHVLQGESELAADNRSLGKFTLSNLPLVHAGVPRILVAFFVNADGVVEISASEQHSGVRESLVISHSFLSAEERQSREPRKQQRRPASRARRGGRAGRREVGGAPVSASQERRGASEKVLPGRTDKAATEMGNRAKTQTQNFSEIDLELHEIEPARAEHKPAVSVAVKMGGGLPAMPVERAGVTPRGPFASGETREEVAEAQTIVDRIVERVASSAPRKERPSSVSRVDPFAAPAPSPRPVDLSDPVELAESSAALGREDTQAVRAYQAAVPAIQERLSATPGDISARLLLARFLLFSRKAEECREALAAVVLLQSTPSAETYTLYSQLIERFPNYFQARRERAELALKTGRFEDAMEDLEAVQQHSPAETSVTESLAAIYERRLGAGADTSIQFKLVRSYLKLQRIDEAIEILRRLVDDPAHQTRAKKILGLCFWQQAQHELAWQTLRYLPVDEDLKDALYRLGNDIEERDNLTLAREVFEHLQRADPSFRDVLARLKKLAFRASLQNASGQEAKQLARVRYEFNDSRFYVLGEINRGSMGIVYKAQDNILDETVALKVLADTLTVDPISVERFKQEARAAKRLSHPNIVRIHDMFETGVKKCLSMEYIEGEDLKKLLASGAEFSEERILGILEQVLEALSYAHSLGVVHRDIKPANVMINRDGQVKITDFGIAKLLASDRASSTGFVMGTPLYMSPEQIEGRAVDVRADLYSLGIMTYEMLAGHPPFCEGNIEYQHINTPPPPLPSRVSRKMREFVEICLGKKPEDRFSSSGEALKFLKA